MQYATHCRCTTAYPGAYGVAGCPLPGGEDAGSHLDAYPVGGRPGRTGAVAPPAGAAAGGPAAGRRWGRCWRRPQSAARRRKASPRGNCRARRPARSTTGQYYVKQAVTRGVPRDQLQPGSVTFIRRFGSAINLNLHFHGVFLEGV